MDADERWTHGRRPGPRDRRESRDGKTKTSGQRQGDGKTRARTKGKLGLRPFSSDFFGFPGRGIGGGRSLSVGVLFLDSLSSCHDCLFQRGAFRV